MLNVPRPTGRTVWRILLSSLVLAANVAHAASTLRIWGEPGEPMTGGGVIWFDSTTTFRFEQRLGGLSCSIGAPVFTLEFRGSALHPLATGTHGPLVANPNDNESMMYESYQFTGCRPPSGSFQVRKLAFHTNGTLRQAWITWTTRCLTNLPRQFGELRVNADTTLWQDLPADKWCTAGDSASFDVRAFHATGRNVTFQVSGMPVGATFVDLGDGQARFRWKSTLAQVGLVVPVTVIASDDQGVRDTSMTRVRIVPNARLVVFSDPGDAIAGGRSFELSGPETAVQISEQQVNRELHLTWLNRTDRVNFTLAAPSGRRLEPGAYEDATRAGFQASMIPGLDVSSLVGCNKESGRFTVRRLARDTQGAVIGIWAVVEDHCENAKPAFRCDMRYNTDTTLYVQAPADVNVEVGQPVTFTAAAIGTVANRVNLEATDLPAGAAFTRRGTDAGTFSWLAPTEPVTELAVRFAGTDDQGGRTEVVTRIHVSRPERFYLKSTVADCNLPNQTLVLTQLNADFSPLPRDSSEAWVRVEGGNQRASVNLRAPFGMALRKGTFLVGPYEYTGADRFIGYMTYGLDGYSYYVGGDFHVRKWRTDSNGFTRSLWATWRSGCGATTTTTGQIIMNADTSLYLTAPGIAMVERGESLQLDVAGTSVAGAPVTLSCPQRPTGATFTPTAPGRARLAWNASVPAGNALATFIGSDATGNADTMTTLIRVMRPQRFTVKAPTGHWITAGGATSLDATNSNFQAVSPDLALLYLYSLGHTWVLRVTAPYLRRVTPGVYVAGRQYFPGAASRVPTLSLSSRFQGTSADSVWFHVRKIAFDEQGQLAQLWMPFDIQEYGAGHVKGELRFGDPDTTLYIEAPADVYVNPESSTGFIARAVHALGGPLTLSARGLPAAASFVDQGDGTGRFTWSANAPPNSTFPVTVVARDEQGVTDTCVTYVHVVVPATLRTLRGSPEPLDPWAVTSNLDAARSEFRMYPFMEHGAVIEIQEDSRLWYLYFAAPNDALLTTRTYTGAVGPYEAYGQEPILGVIVNGEYCSYGTGSTFSVQDASYDEAGHLVTFAATFRDSCDSRPALSGELRYGAHSGVVATLASRMLADGEGGFARLMWSVSTTSGSLRLERRPGNGGEWVLLGSSAPDGLGRLSFEDRDVAVGLTYDYRLTSASGTLLDQVSITIRQPAGFRILSVGPNPVSRTLTLQTAGRSDGPVRLQVLDIAGRVVWSDVLPATSGPRVELRMPGDLPQGVYMLRATIASKVGQWRFAIVR